jgi:FtsP/CotA-like multicopper oxidase with cupredoxin domain
MLPYPSVLHMYGSPPIMVFWNRPNRSQPRRAAYRDMSEFPFLSEKRSSRGFLRFAAELRAQAFCVACMAAGCALIHAQGVPSDRCPRPSSGSEVQEPEDLRSRDGVLQVNLAVQNYKEKDGSTRYCYLLPDGSQSPTLRLKPGDLLILKLKNNLTDSDSASAATNQSHHSANSAQNSDPCQSGLMSPTSTNLHFHGLTVPPVCHQDDVLKTSIQPEDPPFEYRFRIPENEPPGLYWYHPHIHGFNTPQVLGGASGALIVEGIERANPNLAGLPERVFVIRDQDLMNPDAPPSKSEPAVPKVLIDRDGDSLNNGTGTGKPAKDLSVNFVPAPYPDYPPAIIKMKPGERQLWRVLNASAVTYLNLAVLFNGALQKLGMVAMDGVSINLNPLAEKPVDWRDYIGLPPGGRVEFIVDGPPAGVPGLFMTGMVDTGQGGENDPNRALASIIAATGAPEPRSVLGPNPVPLPPPALPWLGSVKPARIRKLYFSEKLQDPSNPNSATTFFITVDGETPAPFDPTSGLPNIVVKQGDVEDWIIENRTTELHVFHIHQIHFQLVASSGAQLSQSFLRDTVNVPYYNGRNVKYPSVRLRMDFRDPNVVGTFVYHCHLSEHEDGGMMGIVRVEPADKAQIKKASTEGTTSGDKATTHSQSFLPTVVP